MYDLDDSTDTQCHKKGNPAKKVNSWFPGGRGRGSGWGVTSNVPRVSFEAEENILGSDNGTFFFNLLSMRGGWAEREGGRE